MIRTYFLQKIKKHALSLLVLQGAILVMSICCFHFSITSIKAKNKQLSYQKTMNYNELLKTNIWNLSEVSSMELFRFRETIMKRARGVEFWRPAARIDSIGTKYREKIMVYREIIESLMLNSKSVLSNIEKEQLILKRAKKEEWKREIETVLEDFHCDVKSELYEIFEDENDPDRGAFEYERYGKEQIIKKRKILQSCVFNQTEDILLMLNALSVMIIQDSHTATKYCIVSMGWGSLFFGSQCVKVVTKSNVVREGEDFVASIFLERRANSLVEKIIVDGDTLQTDKEEKAHYRIKTGKVGTHRVKIQIPTNDPFLGPRTYVKEFEYIVLPKTN